MPFATTRVRASRASRLGALVAALSALTALTACGERGSASGGPSGASAADARTAAPSSAAPRESATASGASSATPGAPEGSDARSCPPSAAQIEAFDRCRAAKGKTGCEAAGGRWARGTISMMCFCTAPDANCPCRKPSDCSAGACQTEGGAERSASSAPCAAVESGRCAWLSPAEGCYCTMQPEGGVWVLCVD